MKKLGSYIAYIFFFGLIVYWGVKYEEELGVLEQFASNINPFPLMIFTTVFPIVIGVLIAIPGLASNFIKTGSWSVNWIKMVVIGLPTFIVSISYLMYFSKIGKYLHITSSWVINGKVITISGIIFGYTVLASIYKAGECTRG